MTLISSTSPFRQVPRMTPGIIFDRVSGEIDLRLTRRSDLVADRIARGAAREMAVIETPSRDMAKKLRRVLERVFVAAGAGGLMTVVQAEDAITRCRRMGFNVHTAETLRRKKQVLAGHAPIIEKRRVPDPSMSRAELLHQLERWPDARWIGYVRADVSMGELIGGLSRIRKRTETQTQAAAEFKSLAERAMLGAGGAIDYSAARVDTSPTAGNPVADTGEDARRRLAELRAALGPLSTIAERVIVNGELVSDVAASVGRGKGGAARDRVTRMLLDATNILASELGLVARGQKRKGGEHWDDGSQQVFTADGERAVIVNKRAA